MYVYIFYKLKSIANKNIKYILYYFTLLLLLMDVSSVTYIYKINIFSLLLISMIGEFELKNDSTKVFTYEN